MSSGEWWAGICRCWSKHSPDALTQIYRCWGICISYWLWERKVETVDRDLSLLVHKLERLFWNHPSPSNRKIILLLLGWWLGLWFGKSLFESVTPFADTLADWKLLYAFLTFMREKPLIKKLDTGELLKNKTDKTTDLGHLCLFILICLPIITPIAMACHGYQRSWWPWLMKIMWNLILGIIVNKN